MDRRVPNTFIHERMGLFIISAVTFFLNYYHQNPKFNLEYSFPQCVIQLWVTRVLWWELHIAEPDTQRATLLDQIYIVHSKERKELTQNWLQMTWGLIHAAHKKRWLLCLFQYVPENLLPVYREKIVPLSDILTPNQFEAEWVQYHLKHIRF